MLMLCNDSFVIPGLCSSSTSQGVTGSRPLCQRVLCCPHHTPRSRTKTDLMPEGVIAPHYLCWANTWGYWCTCTCTCSPGQCAPGLLPCRPYLSTEPWATTRGEEEELENLLPGRLLWAASLFGVQACFLCCTGNILLASDQASCRHAEGLWWFRVTGKLCAGLIQSPNSPRYHQTGLGGISKAVWRKVAWRLHVILGCKTPSHISTKFIQKNKAALRPCFMRERKWGRKGQSSGCLD